MLRNLLAEMARREVSINDLAKAIGKSERSVRDKVKGKYEFSVPEAKAIRDSYFAGMSLEYLFTPASAKPNDQSA